jgi:hypothetical protein
VPSKIGRNAAHGELLHARVALLDREEAQVGLRVAAQLQLEVTRRRLQEEAVLPAGEHLLRLQLVVDDLCDLRLVERLDRLRLARRRRRRRRLVETPLLDDALQPADAILQLLARRFLRARDRGQREQRRSQRGGSPTLVSYDRPDGHPCSSPSMACLRSVRSAALRVVWCGLPCDGSAGNEKAIYA